MYAAVKRRSFDAATRRVRSPRGPTAAATPRAKPDETGVHPAIVGHERVGSWDRHSLLVPTAGTLGAALRDGQRYLVR
ncbi:hypothetical protein GCM10009557_42230 [Virgisporangium ochraceum]